MRLFRTLTLSLGLHFVLAWALSQIETKPILTPPPALVEFLESPQPASPHDKYPDDTKQFVRSAPAPSELLTDEDRQARFSSEEEQNVLEERKARRSGMTANRSPLGSNDQKSFSLNPSKEKSSKHEAKRKPMEFTPESPLERGIAGELNKPMPDSGMGEVKIGGVNGGEKKEGGASDGSKPLDLPNFMGAEKGFSTSGESMPDDVKFGDFTALNTDRHLYYTFYARIEEGIRPRWESYVRSLIYGYETGARKLSGGETWRTKLEIILDREGNFIRALLY